MPKEWVGSWKGGRIARDKDGRSVYVLRKQNRALVAAGLPGRPTIFLGAITEDDALAELAAFRKNPVSYVRQRDQAEAAPSPAAAPVRIDAAIVERFLAYLTAQGRSDRYVKNVRFYLGAWIVDLKGRDLRSLKLPDLLKVLSTYPRTEVDTEAGQEVTRGAARRHRTIALKSFCSWLRETEGALTQGEDCTLSLKVPAPRPEKARRAAAGGHKGYKIEDVERLYTAINGWESKKWGWKPGQKTEVQPVRDVLLLHAKTGMHGTEIERLARGEGTVRAVVDQGEIAGTVTFIHKSGRVHVQSLDRQALAAALRLQARGSAPVDSNIRNVVKRAVKAAGLQPLRFGELRHSFVTWARERGEEVRPVSGGLSLEAIAAAIGHQSVKTTSRFYDNTQIPPMIRIPMRLEHPEDPPLPSPAESKKAKGKASRAA